MVEMRKGILLICLLFLLASCGVQKQTSPLDYVDKVYSTDLSGEKAESISLGATEQLLVDSKGQPKEKVAIINSLINWVYPDMSHYTLMDHVVVSYGFNIDSNMSSSKDVKVGDSIHEAKIKYGQAFYSRKQDNFQFVGYIDKENNIAIEFLLQQNVIAGIMVSQLDFFAKMEDRHVGGSE